MFPLFRPTILCCAFSTILFICLLTGSSIKSQPSLSSNKNSNITDKVALRSFGKIQFGMTVEQAVKVSPIPLVYFSGYSEDGKPSKPFVVHKDISKDPKIISPESTEHGCYYLHFKNHLETLGFMVTEGKVKRVDVYSNSISTLSGARVGYTEEQIKKIYGNKLKTFPHKYLENGHYLIYIPEDDKDSKYRLIFETDGKKVTQFRAGLLPDVVAVEGCL